MPVDNAQPRKLSRRHVERLLMQTRGSPSLAARIDAVSSSLLGRPYVANPLIGSATAPEQFSASTEGFDCVTYIETVLALALASDVTEFLSGLRKIRYAKGRIGWKSRNHYMTGWILSNQRQGLVTFAPMSGLPLHRRQRVLNVVSGIPVRRITVKCVPKQEFRRASRRMQTGDLAFFASTRKHLDIFHAGIIVCRNDRTLLRHASRSRGKVVQQSLDDFIRENRMAGVIAVRPCEPASRIGPRDRRGHDSARLRPRALAR